ncbi:MAG: sporulation protein [Firmicutes bacterium]|nr:sporulation protein [Bacillota bacterium]
MKTKKMMLPVLFMLFLLLFSLASPAAACTLKEVASGQKIPLKICLQNDDGKGNFLPIVYRLEIPLKNGETKTRFIINKCCPVPCPPQKPEPGPAPKPDPAPAPEPAPEPQPGSILTEEEMQMLQLVNEERRKAGLQPLQIHEGLVKLARLKSEDMIKLGYFSHHSPTYGSPFEMISGAGIAYRTAGENIAGAPTVDRAHQALMNSSGHRANILNAGFTHVGIGIIDGGPYGKMFTQMFIGER